MWKCAATAFGAVVIASVSFLQAALERTLGALDLSTVAPKPPAVAAIDGSRIVVKIAGTTPAPTLLAVEGVEVQQECGPVTAVVSTAADVTLARTTPSDRLRLRWLKDGVRGPWSDWVPVVSGCCAEWGVCVVCA